MAKATAKADRVRGYRIPKPRLTGWGWFYIAIFIGLPAIGTLLLLDIALWAVFRFGLDSCYGVLCLLR